jgi:ribA/ribD-fused uncharacterized protein
MGKVWPTAERYFQAQKYAGSPDEEEIRLEPSPMIAARTGRDRKRALRADWEMVKDDTVRRAVLAKYRQRGNVR